MTLSRWLQASRKVEGGSDAHSTRLFLVWLGLQLLHMLLLFTVSLLWAVGSVRASNPPTIHFDTHMGLQPGHL